METQSLTKTQLLKYLECLGEDIPPLSATKADLITIISGMNISEREHKLALQFLKQENRRTITNHPQIKLPTFAESHTQLWIEQVNTILNEYPPEVRRITLISSIPTNIWSECGASPTDSYEKIMETFRNHFVQSQEEKLDLALKEVSLGDRKPSRVLRHLQELIPNNQSLIKYKFFQMLPKNIKIVIKSHDDGLTNIESLANMADDLLKSDVIEKSNFSIQETEVQKMINKFQEMETEINEIKNKDSQDLINNVCWYHFTFGKKSRKCSKGCKYEQISRNNLENEKGGNEKWRRRN